MSFCAALVDICCMFGVVPLLGASAERHCVRSEFEQKLVIQSHFKENIIHAHATLKHQPNDCSSDGDDPHIGDAVAYSALGLSLDGKGLGGLAGCGRRCCLVDLVVGFGKLGPWAGNG